MSVNLVEDDADGLSSKINIITEFVYYWENLEVTRSYGYGIDITFSNVPVDDRR